MAERARHAYGSRQNLSSAIQSGAIDAYDVLFLNGENEAPTVGWVDKDGNPVVIDTEKVVVVEGDALPESGEVGRIYIFADEGYLWNGTEFKPMSKSSDLSSLESQVSDLESQISNKVDEATVDSKVEAAVEAAIKEVVGEEIVEF